ncbi:MAG: hypothetical protein U0T74_08855 [Chitinophagales bacterium]
MKNISLCKICILLIAVFSFQLLAAQAEGPAPPPPAYEKTVKNKKKKRGTEPDVAPAFDETPATTGDNNASPATEDEETQTTDTLSFWEEENPDEYPFKKQFDLFILWKFLGNYSEGNRIEIRRDRESIFYSTEKTLPGAIDKYIEVKNKQGEFKFVFYRGSDREVAESKYRQIADIAKRVTDKDHTELNRSYCNTCTGVAYVYAYKPTADEPSYWVQLITKPNNLYEVQVIGSVNLADEYLKEVAKPVAATSNSAMPIPALNETKVKYNFCSDLEKVVRAKIKSFEDLKVGEKLTKLWGASWWHTNFTPGGFDSAYVISNGNDSKYLTYVAQRRVVNYESAYQDYKALIEQIKSCSFMLPLCTNPVSFTGQTTKETTGTQTTLNTYIGIVSDDKHHYYSHLVVTVGISKVYNENTWQVIFTVDYKSSPEIYVK